MTTASDIIAYYDRCEVDYRLLWHLDTQMAMHYGLWHPGVRSLRGALRRQNEYLASLAEIRSGERVLDAGCGVGGGAIYLARETGARVTGITLSERQVARCKANAERSGVGDRTQFLARDFTATNFPDASFDVVWAVESVCHATDKAAFLREAHRLLTPGGRLVLADFFRENVEAGSRDERLLQNWAQGWAVPDFARIEDFTQAATEAGFASIVAEDATRYVARTSRRLYLYSFPARIITRIFQALRLRDAVMTRNVHAARSQYLSLQRKLWTYRIVTAGKE